MSDATRYPLVPQDFWAGRTDSLGRQEIVTALRRALAEADQHLAAIPVPSLTREHAAWIVLLSDLGLGGQVDPSETAIANGKKLGAELYPDGFPAAPSSSLVLEAVCEQVQA